MEPELELILDRDIHFHRNGVCGAPFHVVLFHDVDAGDMLGIVFAEPHHVAVLRLEELYEGDVAFGHNSWRGDRYEGQLRDAIEARRQGGRP